jgi:excisionase family DNA binding protein
MTSERAMTTTEVARILHVSRQSVTRWIRDGRMEAITISVGSRRPVYRVTETAFRAFVRAYVRGLD